MVILWRLLFGHFLADFTFQSNYINSWKRTSHLGMIVHCAIHPVFYFLFTFPFINDYWISNPLFQIKGWACILIVFAAHYIEDQWRVFTIFKYNTPDNTLYFVWDQIIHYAVIFAVIPLGQLGSTAMTLFPEKWPIFGCLFVLATHACTVFVYFIEKDLYKKEQFPHDREKYFGMAERLVLALCFLLPGFLWLAAIPWLGVMYAVRLKRKMNLSWFGFYLGGAVAVGCGVAARMLYYS